MSEINYRKDTMVSKNFIEALRTNRPVAEITKEEHILKWAEEQEKICEHKKKMLTEEFGKAHFAKDKDNTVKNKASKTGRGKNIGRNIWMEN